MEVALRGAEAVRRVFWRWSARTSLGLRCVNDRRLRMTVLACGHMTLALVLVTVAPLWLLLLGPLLLGVPHLVADLRYLVLSPAARMPRRVALAIGLPLLVMSALRLTYFLGGPLSLRGEAIAGAVALLAAMAFADARPRARILGLCLGGALSLWAISQPYYAALTLGHAHNVVALGLWMWWTREDGPRWPMLVVGGVFAAASALILSGVLEPAALALGAFESPSTGLDFESMTQTLAPGLSPELGGRLVLLYAFAQAVHYTLWLRLIPNAARHQTLQTPPSFRRSLRALAADLGKVGVAVAVALSALVVVSGAFRPASTRELYLTLALFHGWLELAAIAHGAVRR